MTSDIEQIKQLREATGAGVMDARRALADAQGDLEKAKEIIYHAGLAKAEKKKDRDVKSGFIYSYIHSNQKIGVLLELNCETDFVARTDEFIALAREVSMQVAAMNPDSVDALLEQEYIRDGSKKIKSLIDAVIGKLGENVTLRRFVRFELGEKIGDSE